jgi:hypothetical protein
MRRIIGILLIFLGGAGLLLDPSERASDSTEIWLSDSPQTNAELLSGSTTESVSTGDYWSVIEIPSDTTDTCGNKKEVDLYVRDK